MLYQFAAEIRTALTDTAQMESQTESRSSAAEARLANCAVGSLQRTTPNAVKHMEWWFFGLVSYPVSCHAANPLSL